MELPGHERHDDHHGKGGSAQQGGAGPTDLGAFDDRRHQRRQAPIANSGPTRSQRRAWVDRDAGNTTVPAATATAHTTTLVQNTDPQAKWFNRNPDHSNPPVVDAPATPAKIAIALGRSSAGRRWSGSTTSPATRTRPPRPSPPARRSTRRSSPQAPPTLNPRRTPRGRPAACPCGRNGHRTRRRATTAPRTPTSRYQRSTATTGSSHAAASLIAGIAIVTATLPANDITTDKHSTASTSPRRCRNPTIPTIEPKRYGNYFAPAATSWGPANYTLTRPYGRHVPSVRHEPAPLPLDSGG